jgi:flagellar basal-body rod protein FlgF
MNVGYFYAIRGAIKQDQRMDCIANNLANANTTGFKQDKVDFEDFLINSNKPDFTQGAVRQTDRELDVAIQGPGFFKVQTPDGVAYTRDGSFHLDDQGNLVTGQGYPVLGDGGQIKVGQGAGPIVIDSKGNVRAGESELGRLAVVDLESKDNLKGEGGSLYVWDGQGQAQEVEALDCETVQGHLEQSNVKVVVEMANMIECSRAFEAHLKAIQSMFEIDQKAAASVGRLRA